MPLLRPHRTLVALLVFLPAAAGAAPPRPSTKASHSAPSSHKTASAKPGLKTISATFPLGKSIGSPTEGHLLGGAHLGDAPYLRIYPAHAHGDVRWGLGPLVGLIDRSAASVRKQFPDAVLSVGHLSKAGGGELERHASHESGRDADVGFYVKNQAGKPIYSDHMVSFLGDGTAPTWPGARFDDARNWAFVAALVGDGRARITHIFVATPIRQRLLAYAEKIGSSPAIRSRAAEVLAQPRGALPHDDHFHIRIACPNGMDKCVELPTARNRRGHAHGHDARVASSHGAQGAQGAQGRASTSGHASAAAPKPAPSHPAAAPPRPSKPIVKGEDDESAKSEALVPSLAPSVPGLDSAVIPAPLAGVRSTWGTSKDQAPTAPAPSTPPAPISDPDGVLDAH